VKEYETTIHTATTKTTRPVRAVGRIRPFPFPACVLVDWRGRAGLRLFLCRPQQLERHRPQ